jgi:fucose permease
MPPPVKLRLHRPPTAAANFAASLTILTAPSYNGGMSWNLVYLLIVSGALTLAVAGIGRLIGKSLIKRQFSSRDLLYLMALMALAVVILGAGLNWSPEPSPAR